MPASTTLQKAATGTAAFLMPAAAAPRRCGSYPLMNLAEDFGVAYGDVLELTQAVGEGRYRSLEPGRRRSVEAASRRIWTVLGDGTSHTLYARLRAVLGR